MKTELFLGAYSNGVKEKLASANNEQIISRIWTKDHTVWSDNPSEIVNRLGWLDISFRMEKVLGEINDFVTEVKDEFDEALLLGMGGSSLAPEVFANIFGVKPGYIKVRTLDSTHPDFVKRIADSIDYKKTLFIVSTKSGGTAETMSMMKFFFNRCIKHTGGEAGKNFVAITDPGSGLENLSHELKFRKTFLNDPNIGGRFSALSYFGLVPALLTGADIKKLIVKTNESICLPQNTDCLDADENIAANTGIAIGYLADKGRNKLTFIVSESLKNFGDWVEQLIAESTGKLGKGILPVVDEEDSLFEYFGNDRLPVFINVKGDSNFTERSNKLREAGFPVIEQSLEDIYDLGSLIYFWEFATATAGWVMELQPFDQPNVESAKIAARELMKAYSESGELPNLDYDYSDENMKVKSTLPDNGLEKLISGFLEKLSELHNPYLSLHCYSDYLPQIKTALNTFRKSVTKKYRIPVTIGFGPRFLHSTGQLHKGDDGNGLFIQFFQEPSVEVAIPDQPAKEESSVSFNVLVRAQSLGDRNALIQNKRNVLRIESKDVTAAIYKLLDSTEKS